jgi:WhiB family redox-sensing transcriptional regulator
VSDKLVTVDHRPAWQSRARCRGMSPELFYPERGQNSDVAAAKAVCRECPVLEDCRAWGIAHEKNGIWGGLTERERRKARRELGIRFRGIAADPSYFLSAPRERRSA